MDASEVSHQPVESRRSAFRGRRALLGSVAAIARRIVAVVRNPDRPAIFDLFFWTILVLTYAYRALDPLDLDLDPGLAPVTTVGAVLVAVWLALPWRRDVSRTRKLAAPAFLLATTALLYAGQHIWAFGLYPIAFANAAFLFGLWRSYAYAAGTILTLLCIAVFVRGRPDDIVWYRMLLLAFATVVVNGLAAAVMQARRSQERAEALLGDLESAHMELRRYAERVRELTLAEERTRIARDMHDAVGHHLTAVKLQTEAALKTVEKRPERAREQVERARDLAAEAFEEVRRAVRALKPPALGERSGLGALRALVHNFEGAGFDLHLRVEGEERELPEEVELVLYRALQESLTNAARHSAARRVGACLAYGSDKVTLAVVDDGAGTTEDALTGGFGLAALKERVEAVGGAFSAGNVPEGGFAVRVVLLVSTPPGAPPGEYRGRG